MAEEVSLGSLIAKIGFDTSGIQPAVAKFKSGMAESEEGASRFSGIATAGFMAVGVAAVAFLGESIKKAVEGQEAQARLGQAIQDAGGHASEAGPLIEGLSRKYAALGFSNDETSAAMGNLVTITKSTTTAQKDLAIAADLAAYKNISLQDAAQQVGKVSAGNTKVLKALGLATKDASGQTLTAAAAMKELSGAIGGQAQAHAQTFAGQMKVLHAEFSNLEEKVGNAVLPVLNAFLHILVEIIGPIEDAVGAVGHFINKFSFVSGILDTATGFLGLHKKKHEELKPAIDNTTASTADFGNATDNANTSLKATAKAASDAKKALKALMDAVNVGINTNLDLDKANIALADGVDTLTEKLKASGGQLGLNTKSTRDSSSAFDDLVQKVEDTSAAKAAAGKIDQDATSIRNDEVTTLRTLEKTMSGPVKKAIDDYITQLQSIKNIGPISTPISVGFIGPLTAGERASAKPGDNGFIGPVAKHASGGFIPPGSTGIVGDQGPEAVHVSSSGARVMPHGNTGKSTGANYNLTINTQDVNTGAVMAALRRMELMAGMAA